MNLQKLESVKENMGQFCKIKSTPWYNKQTNVRDVSDSILFFFL